jgi:hypothetical protein
MNPNVSIDCVVFGFDGSELKVLVLQRDLRDNLALGDDTLVLPGDLILDNVKGLYRTKKHIFGADRCFWKSQ